MKRAVIAILAAMVMGAGTLPAQTLEVRRVGLDSLVHFLRKEFNPEIYFIMDEKEQSSFTVSAPRDRFMEAAFDQMREKGYVISSYGNARFILNSTYTLKEIRFQTHCLNLTEGRFHQRQA